MNEVQINKIKKRADEYATSCFPYEKQFLEREAVVKCCVHVVTVTIAELEKEIAELKKKNLDTQDAVTMQMYTNKANKEIADKQLTKAKEIIRSLYFIIQGRIDYKGNIPLEDEMYRANQFLNSEVEK